MVPLMGLGPQAQEGRPWPEAKEAPGPLPRPLPHPLLASLVFRHHSWTLVVVVGGGAEPLRVTLGPKAQEGRSWPPAKEAPGIFPCLLPSPWLATLVGGEAEPPWPEIELSLRQ